MYYMHYIFNTFNDITLSTEWKLLKMCLHKYMNETDCTYFGGSH